MESEVAHLPAGLSHLTLGRFDLYRVNPPLPRIVAAVPVALFCSPRTDWRHYDSAPTKRAELRVAHDFIDANGYRSFSLDTVGRWACIPFSLLGGLLCFCWARRLHGVPAGLMALILWSFSPTILGHSPLIMPDVPAAALGLLALYTLWGWLRQPGWERAILAGLTLGLAQLTKLTCLVMYPTYLLIWPVCRRGGAPANGARGWLREGAMMLTILLISGYVTNLGYLFEGSFARLDSYPFQSKILSGLSDCGAARPVPSNRFADSWFGRLRVPLPRDYIQGIDRQKSDFERRPACYLSGTWQRGGWWYFYLYALAVKVPLGAWALFLLSLIGRCSRPRNLPWRDEVVLLLPAILLLALASCQAGLTMHLRYLMPAFPLVFIWTSSVLGARRGDGRKRRVIILLLLGWYVSSSLYVYPHTIAYFNALAGGPANGHKHLLGSNLDWGQDALYLRGWLRRHPQLTNIRMAIYIYHIDLAEANRVRRQMQLPELPRTSRCAPPDTG